MIQETSKWLALISILISSSVAQTPIPEPESHSQLFVRLYNYSEVPPGALGRAKQEAHRTLAAAGIEAVWIDCPTTAAEVGQYPACEQLVHSPAVLQVKILSREMAERIRQPRGKFGYAVLSDRERFALVANVFANRAEQLAKSQIASRAMVLGHIMAHEIGHLLLGRGSHSQTGIMRTPWDKHVLTQISRGWLLFTASQARRMQQEVLARIAAARELTIIQTATGPKSGQRQGVE